MRRDTLRLSAQNFCSTLSSRDEIYGEALESAEVSSVTELVDRYCHVSTMQEQVLVIQPFIRHGILAKTDTNHDLMLQESIALVKTLNWKVADHIVVGLPSFQRKHLFGSGKLKLLEEKVASNLKITSVFISLYQLTITQRLELERVFSVPVIDSKDITWCCKYSTSTRGAGRRGCRWRWPRSPTSRTG